MDPDATLLLVVVIARKIAQDAAGGKKISFRDLLECSGRIDTLNEWISSGGFVPKALYVEPEE